MRASLRSTSDAPDIGPPGCVVSPPDHARPCALLERAGIGRFALGFRGAVTADSARGHACPRKHTRLGGGAPARRWVRSLCNLVVGPPQPLPRGGALNLARGGRARVAAAAALLACLGALRSGHAARGGSLCPGGWSAA